MSRNRKVQRAETVQKPVEAETPKIVPSEDDWQPEMTPALAKLQEEALAEYRAGLTVPLLPLKVPPTFEHTVIRCRPGDFDKTALDMMGWELVSASPMLERVPGGQSEVYVTFWKRAKAKETP